MNRLIRYATPVAVMGMGLAAYGLLHWAAPEPEKTTDTPRPLSVFVEKVENTNVDLLVRSSGEVRAQTRIDIVAQVGGRIASVSPEFVEGGRVEPDKPLIKIEKTDYELALSQARVRVAEAEVGVQEALANAAVARRQLREATSASPLALKQPQVAEAQARLVAAKANLQQARLDLDRTQISLPFQGRVITKAVDVGEFVTAGKLLGRAFATNVVEVRVPFSDSQLASLGLPIGFVANEGNSLPVALTAEVAGKEQFWNGRLVRLDASVDPKTRMVYGIVVVKSPYKDGVSQRGMPLAVGLFVNAEIAGRRVTNAHVIPREALRAGNQVYVVNRDSKLEIRDVSVTHSTEMEAIIEKGVEVGEKVIVSSIRNPIEGMALEAMLDAYDDAAVAEHPLERPIGS